MVKERRTELVQGFRHSVPYINAHRGKTFVIMLGGEAIEHENFSSIVNDIGLLHSLGIRLVVSMARARRSTLTWPLTITSRFTTSIPASRMPKPLSW